MFCYKCGAQISEGAAFCHKCGAKIAQMDAAPGPAAPAPVPPETPRTNDIPPAAAKEKKSKKPLIIFGVIGLAVLAIAAVAFVALNWEGKTDYEATVRAYTPYAKSQGMPYTCGEVFDRYIPNAEWNVRTSDDVAYVDISGIAKGIGKELSVTIRVEVEGDVARMEPVAVRLDGEKRPEDVFFALFLAYDNREKDLSNIEELIREVDGALGNSAVTAPGSDPGEQELAAAKAAYAAIVRTLASEDGSLTFDLIDLTGSDIPELTAGLDGYYVSVYMWADGEAVPVMEYWPYGAFGNPGYEYLPGQNIIRNYNSDQAGAIVYESYMTVDANHEVVSILDDSLSTWYFWDRNENYIVDDDEPYLEEPIYYYGDMQITEEQYAGYQIPGDYQWIGGDKSAGAMLELLGAASQKGELLCNGTPAHEWFGESIDTVRNAWGTPLNYVDAEWAGETTRYCEYDGITFSFYRDRTIFSISMDSDICSLNGISLNKNRAELIKILGVPTSEGWEDYDYDYELNEFLEIYCMNYEGFYEGANLMVYLSSLDSAADRIMIQEDGWWERY